MSQSVRDSVCQAIAKREAMMREQLAAHVAIPTGYNNTSGLEEYRGLLVDRLTALGAELSLIPGTPREPWLTPKGTVTDTVQPMAVLRKHTSDGQVPKVMIAGHLDTVFDPAGTFREMVVSSDGTTANGPGVVDMKGGILIAVTALEALAECGVDIPWTVTFNSDEETGSYFSHAALAEVSKQHKFGLALEPALPGGELAIQRRGSGQFMVEAHGRSAHAGRAFFEGASAVYALARTLTRIEPLSDEEEGISINVGPLEGGIATNVVPDFAAAWGNVRYPSQEAAEALGAKMDALQTDEDTMPRVVIRRSFNRPAKPLIPETEALALTARRVAESLGQRLPFASTGGVCDGNIMQAAGLPTIDTLGVRGGDLHRTTEWIELRSLVERSQLMACLLLELHGIE
ncbi:MAG: M20/M25/M40 family metallo-hydrolase [Phycisphaerales bacterium JB050]